jgi:N6-adenosine-specific RNA methylase IME4
MPDRNAIPSRAAKYRTIVVDPPWDHSDGTGVDIRRGHVTGLPYSTMTTSQIKALPVRHLSDNVDDDADLYLWTTSRYLRDAFDVAAAWGFHYAATLVWCKPSRGWSTGGAFQNNVEFVLYCKRPKVTRRPRHLRITTYLADAVEAQGITRQDVDRFMGTSDMAGWWLSRIEHRCAVPTDEQWEKLRGLLNLDDSMTAAVREINAQKGTIRKATSQVATSRWFQWGRGAHSAKPEAFLDLVEQVSPGPYLELFARRNRLGWDTWGNETLPIIGDAICDMCGEGITLGSHHPCWEKAVAS